MDRQSVWLTQTPRQLDILQLQQSTLEALGFAVGDIIGTGTKVTGLPCTPTAPATLTVNVGPGRIYQTESLEQTAWAELGTPPPGQSGVGGLPTNTEQVTKQGIVRTAATNFSCPAPTISGDSINYLIEVQYQDSDENSTNLFFYNVTNPQSPITDTLTTTRAGVCALQLKAGTAAPTGTQVTPTPDAGWTGVWVITVAFGQTQITATSIALYSPSSFLPNLVGNEIYYCQDSGTVNAYVVSAAPFNGMPPAGTVIILNTSNANTQASTLNATGSPVSIFHNSSANLLRFGDIVAGKNILISDGTHWCTLNAGPTLLSTGMTLNVSTTGSDANDGLTAGTALLTVQHAYNVAVEFYEQNSQTITIQLANGTYSTGASSTLNVSVASTGPIVIQGNTSNAASVVLTSAASATIAIDADGSNTTFLWLTVNNTFSGTGCWCFNVNGGTATLSNIDFSAAPATICSLMETGFAGSQIFLEGPITVATSCNIVMIAAIGSSIIVTPSAPFTISGSPTWNTAFAEVYDCGLIAWNTGGLSMTGSATGKRYNSSQNGVIDTDGAGASAFPGTVAGATASGGIYV